MAKESWSSKLKKELAEKEQAITDLKSVLYNRELDENTLLKRYKIASFIGPIIGLIIGLAI